MKPIVPFEAFHSMIPEHLTNGIENVNGKGSEIEIYGGKNTWENENDLFWENGNENDEGIYGGSDCDHDEMCLPSLSRS